MRKIFLLCLLVSLFGISRSQNIVSASRYFPKVDKVLEFEKAITAHIAKFHSSDWKWRVYEIQTGPDAGGYHVAEGPKTWDEIDKRGNLGADHLTDWNKNVAIYLTDKYSSAYSEFKEDLSTIQLTSFTDKITITHVFPKVGMTGLVAETLRKAKKAWSVDNQTVAVYQSVASGQSQYALVFRLKDGLKELNTNYRKPFKERYESANGEGTLETFYENIAKSAESSWSEMLFYRADLSSK